MSHHSYTLLSMTTPITITILWKTGGEAGEHHAQGCAHQHARNVVEKYDEETTVETVLAIQAECKKYGTKNVVAPCLRKVIR